MPTPMDIDVNNARTRVTEFLDSVSAAGKHDKSKLRVLIARKKNERAKKRHCEENRYVV